jgi:hypothetical protein
MIYLSLLSDARSERSNSIASSSSGISHSVAAETEAVTASI